MAGCCTPRSGEFHSSSQTPAVDSAGAAAIAGRGPCRLSRVPQCVQDCHILRDDVIEAEHRLGADYRGRNDVALRTIDRSGGLLKAYGLAVFCGLKKRPAMTRLHNLKPVAAGSGGVRITLGLVNRDPRFFRCGRRVFGIPPSTPTVAVSGYSTPVISCSLPFES